MCGIDGAWCLLHIGVVNRLDDPSIAGIVLTAHDITARRDAEATQQVSEGHLQAVICQLPIILFALEGTSRFTLSVGRSLRCDWSSTRSVHRTLRLRAVQG